MPNNEQRLSQRHDPAILAGLKRVSDESGIPQVVLVAACIKGLEKTWGEQKELSFPFRVVPEKLYLMSIKSGSGRPKQ